MRAQLAKLSSDGAASEAEAARSELENRLRAMTEHLIAKQNQIETISSERAYLQLKLEQEAEQRQALERLQQTLRSTSMIAGDVRPIASLIRRRGDDDGDHNDDDDDHDDEADAAVHDDSGATYDNAKGVKTIEEGRRRRVAPGTPSKRARSFVRSNAISAANALDSISRSTGRFLGMSPLARLALILYSTI